MYQLQVLIDAKAKVEATDATESTPLHCAIEGLQPKEQGSSGQSNSASVKAKAASTQEYIDLVSDLIEAGAAAAAAAGAAAVGPGAIEKGDLDGDTPLILAARFGKVGN